MGMADRKCDQQCKRNRDPAGNLYEYCDRKTADIRADIRKETGGILKNSPVLFYPHYPHELKVIHNIQNPQKSIYFCKK